MVLARRLGRELGFEELLLLPLAEELELVVGEGEFEALTASAPDSGTGSSCCDGESFLPAQVQRPP